MWLSPSLYERTCDAQCPCMTDRSLLSSSCVTAVCICCSWARVLRMYGDGRSFLSCIIFVRRLLPWRAGLQIDGASGKFLFASRASIRVLRRSRGGGCWRRVFLLFVPQQLPALRLRRQNVCAEDCPKTFFSTRFFELREGFLSCLFCRSKIMLFSK